jgi:hypothetical protein
MYPVQQKFVSLSIDILYTNIEQLGVKFKIYLLKFKYTSYIA